MPDKGHGQDYVFTKDVDFTSRSLKDDYVTAGVKVGDASNTSLNTNNKTIVGSPNEILTNILSAGYLAGGALTDNLDGTIDVASGAGYIRSANTDTATLSYITWGFSPGISLDDNDSSYVYIDYNSGSPQVAVTTTGADIKNNENDKFELYEIYREGNTLHVSEHRQYSNNAIRRMQQRFYSVSKMQRANSEGGLILGETGTRNVTLSAGSVWIKLDKNNIPAIDTSVSPGVFDRYYSDGGSGWTKQASQTQWNNTQYDDGDGTLGTLGNNKYSFQEFYVEPDGALVSLYAQAEYVSLAGAENAPLLSSVPGRIDEHALYCGRIVFQKDDTTAQLVLSPFGTTLVGATVTDHGTLSGLSDDDHTQYALLSGRSSGQSLIGGTEVSDDLTLESTSNATKGNVVSKDNLVIGDGSIAIPSITFDSATADGAVQWIGATNAFRLATGTEYLQVKVDPTITYLQTSNQTTVYTGAPSPSITTFRVAGSGASSARFELTYGGDANAWTRYQQLTTSHQISFGSSTTQIIWNASNQDVDFKIRGQTDDDLFVIDAANDRVGIGTSAPGAKLHVSGYTMLGDDSPEIEYKTYTGTLTAVGVGQQVTAANLGLTSAKQIHTIQAWALGDDTNWYPTNYSGSSGISEFELMILANGNVQVNVLAGATNIDSNAFKLVYSYQSTNFLT